MDKVKSVFDVDEYCDDVDKSIKTAYEMVVQDDSNMRAVKRMLHKSLSCPRKLDDDDICVRDGYRDIVSMMREVQLAGRTLAAARAEQYDPQGSEDVDPSTRPDYTVMDAIDDARALKARAESASQPNEKAPSSSPAPESASQPNEKAPSSSPAPESGSTVQTLAP